MEECVQSVGSFSLYSSYAVLCFCYLLLVLNVDFRLPCDFEEICALLTCCWLPPRAHFPMQSLCHRAGFLFSSDSWPLKMGLLRCSETSVNKYHTTPRNIPEERRSQSYVLTGLFTYLTSFRCWYIQHVTFQGPSTRLASFVFECIQIHSNAFSTAPWSFH